MTNQCCCAMTTSINPSSTKIVPSPSSFSSNSNSNIIVNNNRVEQPFNFLSMQEVSLSITESKKRKRKASMDANILTDENSICSFLETILPSSSLANTSNTKTSKSSSKRTKRSGGNSIPTATLQYSPMSLCESNYSNPLDFYQSQPKYQMSTTYSTSFLK